MSVAATLRATSHRPWPLPRRPWAMSMQWHDLLFMHWAVPPALLRPLLPPGLQLDTLDGAAYLGVVPFRMADIRPRATPALPRVSAFPELNLRTYATFGGKPGVWFFSLDAADPLAVRVARLLFHLNYRDARMSCEPDGDGVYYQSTRTHGNAPAASFVARYRPTGPVLPEPDERTRWLTERYCLYAANKRGNLWRGEIQHTSWPLQPAEAEIEDNGMTEQVGLTLPATPPLLHFARRLDVVAWLPERVC